jgi:hypothetical protein
MLSNAPPPPLHSVLNFVHLLVEGVGEWIGVGMRGSSPPPHSPHPPPLLCVSWGDISHPIFFVAASGLASHTRTHTDTDTDRQAAYIGGDEYRQARHRIDGVQAVDEGRLNCGDGGDALAKRARWGGSTGQKPR